MAGHSDTTVPVLPASSTDEGAPAGGPDTQYSKAIRKGGIKVHPKLGAYNYLWWAEDMQLHLKAKELWRIVSGKVTRPDEESRPINCDEWEQDDAQALVWIRMNCEKNQYSTLGNKDTSKTAWDALKKKFYNYKAGPRDSIDDVATDLENLKLEIADIKEGHEPSEALVAIALMCAIDDPAYDTAKLLLEREADLMVELSKESLKAVQQKLRHEKGQQRVRMGSKRNRMDLAGSVTTAVKSAISGYSAGTG
ncbi:hypothetical protein MMC22_008824 [Lobaria immixta]|nr:hypothetical protein [Lobaria immixta]